MTTARRQQLDPNRPTWVHCTSRCVRRAFLAGYQFEHRKVWLEERLRYLARCFAVEVAGYAVMSNHVHVIVRLDRAVAMGWSDLEVGGRWLWVYPRKYLGDGTPVLPDEAEIAAQVKDPVRVGKWPIRLADLGWLM